MDLQYVIDVWSCIKYILSYITKKESEESKLLQNAQKEAREDNVDVITELKHLGKLFLTHREVSIMEAVYRALGLRLHQFSRDVVWIPSDPQSHRLH